MVKAERLPPDEAARLRTGRLWAEGFLQAGADAAGHPARAGDGPAPPPIRDDLIGHACLAVQDLRLWWADQVPLPQTRRVAPAPPAAGASSRSATARAEARRPVHGPAGAAAARRRRAQA